MGIRLLPQYEIDKRRAEERRQQAEEGMRIAGRVDTLRETAVSEEEAFARYRTDSLKSIQGEIDILQQERDSLAQDIIQKQIERKALLSPLEKDIEFIQQEKEALLKEKGEHQQKVETLLQREGELYSREQAIENLTSEIESKKRQYESLVLIAKEKEEHVSRLLYTTQRDASIFLESSTKKEAELQNKEKSILASEKALTERMERNDTRAKELNEKELNLIARYTQLELTLERLKQKKQ